MSQYLQIVTIILALILIVVIMAQAGWGGLGVVFGEYSQPGTRTRRGIERSLFRFTVFIAILFVIVCALSVRWA